MLQRPASAHDEEQQQRQLQRSILLTRLPVEILTDILTLLSPPDIVTLGECSRFLYHVSNERQVWTFVLRTASVENNFFLPTYPIATMTTEELKATCTRPWKLRHQIWNGHGLLRPVGMQTLLSYSNAGINNLELVPGGRFLLTTDAQQKLCLWDLGYGTDTLLSQEPLAVKHFSNLGDLGEEWLLISPTADGEGVVRSVSLLNDFHGEVHIIEIYPASNCPQFDTIAVHQLKEEELKTLEAQNMDSNIFGYYADAQLVLWNFRRNTRYRIACREQVYEILIYNGAVLALKADGYLNFSIPTLTITENIVHEIQPISFGIHPLQSTRRPSSAIIWANKQWRIHRFALSTLVAFPGSSSTMLLPLHNEYDDTSKEGDHLMISFAMSGDEHAIFWLDGRFMKLKVTCGPGRAKGVSREGGNIQRWFYEREDSGVGPEQWAWSFCPFTGRVCSLTLRGEVRVMDFVK